MPLRNIESHRWLRKQRLTGLGANLSGQEELGLETTQSNWSPRISGYADRHTNSPLDYLKAQQAGCEHRPSTVEDVGLNHGCFDVAMTQEVPGRFPYCACRICTVIDSSINETRSSVTVNFAPPTGCQGAPSKKPPTESEPGGCSLEVSERSSPRPIRGETLGHVLVSQESFRFWPPHHHPAILTSFPAMRVRDRHLVIENIGKPCHEVVFELGRSRSCRPWRRMRSRLRRRVGLYGDHRVRNSSTATPSSAVSSFRLTPCCR